LYVVSCIGFASFLSSTAEKLQPKTAEKPAVKTEQAKEEDTSKITSKITTGQEAEPTFETDPLHVMMSYQTKFRPIVKKICDYLTENVSFK
jgi:hypothetical protein